MGEWGSLGCNIFVKKKNNQTSKQAKQQQQQLAKLSLHLTDLLSGLAQVAIDRWPFQRHVVLNEFKAVQALSLNELENFCDFVPVETENGRLLVQTFFNPKPSLVHRKGISFFVRSWLL